MMIIIVVNSCGPWFNTLYEIICAMMYMLQPACYSQTLCKCSVCCMYMCGGLFMNTATVPMEGCVSFKLTQFRKNDYKW